MINDIVPPRQFKKPDIDVSIDSNDKISDTNIELTSNKQDLKLNKKNPLSKKKKW